MKKIGTLLTAAVLALALSTPAFAHGGHSYKLAPACTNSSACTIHETCPVASTHPVGGHGPGHHR